MTDYLVKSFRHEIDKISEHALRGYTEKIAEDKKEGWIARNYRLNSPHPDSKYWLMPSDSRILQTNPGLADFPEMFAPYHRYNFSRNEYHKAKWDTEKLKSKYLKNIKKGKGSSVETREMYDELSGRKVKVPKHKDLLPGKPKPVEGQLVPILGSVAGSVLAGGAFESLGKAKKPIEQQIGFKELKKMMDDEGIDFVTQKDIPAHYNPSRRRIAIDPKDRISTLAHEIGHATGRNSILRQIKSGKLQGLNLYGASKLFGLYGMFPLVAGGVAMGDTSFKKSKEDEVKQLTKGQIALGAGSSLYAPVLAEEARASKRALQMMHKIQGFKGVRKGLGNLLPAFGTYAAAGLGPALMAYMFQRKKKKIRKAIEKDKNKPKITVKEIIKQK